MPFFRKSFGYRPSYKPYRKYSGRRAFSKYSRNWTTKNNRAAANQTQSVNMQISSTSTFTHDIAQGAASAISASNIASVLQLAPMHRQMSNVYDQYRIRKVVVKISPIGSNAAVNSYYRICTCIDRNGHPAGFTAAMMTTYSSYKETAIAAVVSNKAPSHYVTVTNDTMFEKSAYYGTKTLARAPVICFATVLPIGAPANTSIAYSATYTYDITYRSVRLDTSDIVGNETHPE